jgi:hypothetical protein
MNDQYSTFHSYFCQMTTTDDIARLKFPIGPFVAPQAIESEELKALIKTIEDAPAKYGRIAKELSENDLAKTYRDGSWNVQQIFNHVADMQMLHFFRMKKALTENDYKDITLVSMDGWAATSDGRWSSVADSMMMFESITRRFVFLMRSLDADQLEISYYHPLRKIMLNQKQAIAMSAWHVSHHLAHLNIALDRR